MDVVDLSISIAIVLAVVGGITIIMRNWVLSVVCNRRIHGMMLTCGIDENTAKRADQLLDLDMAGVRRRCRHCPVPETCESWLAGEAVPSNDFCPNVWHFRRAVAAAEPRLRYDPNHRPGRRLDG